MGVGWATGSALAFTMCLIVTPAMSGKCWCSHVLNVLDLKLTSVAGNGSWVGFGGGVWQWGQLQRKLRALSGVGGMAAGVVCCDPSAPSSSTIALLRCSVSPTVGKISEIRSLDSGTACQHHWLHKQFDGFRGSAQMGICL